MRLLVIFRTTYLITEFPRSRANDSLVFVKMLCTLDPVLCVTRTLHLIALPEFPFTYLALHDRG